MLPRAGHYPGSDLANRRNVCMFSFLPPKLADEAQQRVDGAAPSVARGEARGCPFYGRRDEPSGGPVCFDSQRSPSGSASGRSISTSFRRNSVRASADSLSKMAEDGRHARQSAFTDPAHFQCGLGLAQFILQNGPRGGRSVPCTRSGAPKVRGAAPSFAKRNESIAPAVARRSRAMAGKPARATFEASPAVCYLTRRNWCARPDLRRDYSSLGPRPTIWLPTGAWPP